VAFLRRQWQLPFSPKAVSTPNKPDAIPPGTIRVLPAVICTPVRPSQAPSSSWRGKTKFGRNRLFCLENHSTGQTPDFCRFLRSKIIAFEALFRGDPSPYGGCELWPSRCRSCRRYAVRGNLTRSRLFLTRQTHALLNQDHYSGLS